MEDDGGAGNREGGGGGAAGAGQAAAGHGRGEVRRPARQGAASDTPHSQASCASMTPLAFRLSTPQYRARPNVCLLGRSLMLV